MHFPQWRRIFFKNTFLNIIYTEGKMKTLSTFLVFIFLLTTAQAQETEEPLGSEGTSEIDATLSGNSSNEGFTVKNLGGTTLFRVRGDGNVGIGTTSPGATLHVAANDFLVGPGAGDDLSLEISGVDVKLGDIWGNQFGNYLFIDAEGSGNFQFLGGNVGIGTTNPTSKLQVEGNVDINSDLDVDGGTLHVDGTLNRVGIGVTSPTAKLDVRDGDLHLTTTSANGSSHLRLIENPSFIVGGYLHYDGKADILHIGTNISGDVNTISLPRGTGDVGIGTGSPNYKLDVRGTIGNNAMMFHSDIRWKKNVQSLPNSLDMVTRLRGVNYEWRQDEFPEMNFPEGQRIGLIAQEVEKVIPELVNTAADGYKSVEYANLVAVLIEAVKEQQKQIEALEIRINSIALKELDKESYCYIKTNINK